MPTLENYRDMLCVVTAWTPYDAEPVEGREFYPTGSEAANYWWLIGQECQRKGDGAYMVTDGQNRGKYVYLAKRGHTLPCHTEKRPSSRRAKGAMAGPGSGKTASGLLTYESHLLGP